MPRLHRRRPLKRTNGCTGDGKHTKQSGRPRYSAVCIRHIGGDEVMILSRSYGLMCTLCGGKRVARSNSATCLFQSTSTCTFSSENGLDPGPVRRTRNFTDVQPRTVPHFAIHSKTDLHTTPLGRGRRCSTTSVRRRWDKRRGGSSRGTRRCCHVRGCLRKLKAERATQRRGLQAQRPEADTDSDPWRSQG